MVLDVDDVGASMTFATATIAHTGRPVPPRETASDDSWASASPVRPAAPVDGTQKQTSRRTCRRTTTCRPSTGTSATVRR